MEKKKNGWLKELWRKFMVSLKRRPQLIPLAVLLAAFLVYSLNLTYVSNTTALIQGSGMGLAGFVTMLLSILSFLCFLNAFPYRKKVNKVMLALLLAMLAIIVGADIFYLNGISIALTRAENPIAITEDTAYIAYALYYLQIHIGVLIAGVVLIALLPVYSKLLRKVKTSVEVEGNGDMAAIDISGED